MAQSADIEGIGPAYQDKQVAAWIKTTDALRFLGGVPPRVVLDNPRTGENREVEIYMNNPLRYGGLTFYQAGFDENNDNLANKVTILQVVKNPGWLGPYLACGIMTLGLVVQFGIHLVGFVSKRSAS